MPRHDRDLSPRTRGRKGSRTGPVALSVGAHLGLGLAILMSGGDTLPEPPIPPSIPPSIDVTLVQPVPPVPPAAKPEPTTPAAATTAAASPAAEVVTERPVAATRAPRVRPAPLPPDVEPLMARPVEAPAAMASVGEAELAGATRAGPGTGTGSAGTGGAGQGEGGVVAGSGSGGGGRCDMIRRLQTALRDDPDILAAMTAAHRGVSEGKAVIVWDGDWVQSPGQVGKGLAGVRQAIALEIVFSSPACRASSMRGLALITLDDGPRPVRLVLGKGVWRWSDLVSTRR